MNALATQHPATTVHTYPLSADQMVEISPADVQRGDILINHWGHLIGYVAVAQHAAYGTLTIGAPSGAWTLETAGRTAPLFVAR
jgi:hypothetical protein